MGDHLLLSVRGGSREPSEKRVGGAGEKPQEDCALKALDHKLCFLAVDMMKAKNTLGGLWTELDLGLTAFSASHLCHSHSLTIDCIPHPGQPSRKCPSLRSWCG